MKGLRLPQLEFHWDSWFPVRRASLGHARDGDSSGQDVELTAWCREQAQDLALPDLAGKVLVRWNPRMRTTAGRAWWPDAMIELNPRIKQCETAELWRTLRHELAHLVAFQRSRRRRIKPHGPEWQQACADLGIPGERACHTLPFERRRMKRKHAYLCLNCDTTIERVRPIRGHVACYDCCRKFTNGRFDERFRLIRCQPE